MASSIRACDGRARAGRDRAHGHRTRTAAFEGVDRRHLAVGAPARQHHRLARRRASGRWRAPRRAGRCRCRRRRSPRHRATGGRGRAARRRHPRPSQPGPPAPSAPPAASRSGRDRRRREVGHPASAHRRRSGRRGARRTRPRSVACIFAAVRPANTVPLNTTMAPRPALVFAGGHRGRVDQIARTIPSGVARRAHRAGDRHRERRGRASGRAGRPFPREYRCRA